MRLVVDVVGGGIGGGAPIARFDRRGSVGGVESGPFGLGDARGIGIWDGRAGWGGGMEGEVGRGASQGFLAGGFRSFWAPDPSRIE